ncbi:hypothetical protein GCM10023198_26190 [Promicromonospora umidemergens]|uniref:Uncharacterized protein n=1 Tax=Promicromonospora umidemergens TaxID=629679 RepID=A0ABP8XBJ3_9MICO
MVAAEEQLAYGQNDTHVGLGAAAVAAVEGGERFGRQGRHISIQPFARAVHASPGGRFAASIAACLTVLEAIRPQLR